MALEILSVETNVKNSTIAEMATRPVSITLTVKNTGAATTALWFYTKISSTDTEKNFGGRSIGKDKTSTFTINYDSANLPDDWFEAINAGRASFLNITAHIGPVSSETYFTDFAFIDARYSPKIELFEAERTADEAESIWASIKLSLADGLTETQIGRMVCEVSIWDYTTNAHSVTLTVADLLTGVTKDTTIFTEQFAKGTDYQLTMNFYDSSLIEYASPVQVVVSHSFANLHLSGASTGGACFGGFCQSTENNPMLESRYPIYAYKPIHALDGMVNIQCGMTESAVHANGTEEQVTFNPAFAEVPVIMICMDSEETGSSFGNCFISVRNASESSFTIRYANTSGSERKFAVRWFAYCPTC